MHIRYHLYALHTSAAVDDTRKLRPAHPRPCSGFRLRGGCQEATRIYPQGSVTPSGLRPLATVSILRNHKYKSIIQTAESWLFHLVLLLYAQPTPWNWILCAATASMDIIYFLRTQNSRKTVYGDGYKLVKYRISINTDQRGAARTPETPPRLCHLYEVYILA